MHARKTLALAKNSSTNATSASGAKRRGLRTKGKIWQRYSSSCCSVFDRQDNDLHTNKRRKQFAHTRLRPRQQQLQQLVLSLLLQIAVRTNISHTRDDEQQLVLSVEQHKTFATTATLVLLLGLHTTRHSLQRHTASRTTLTYFNSSNS